MKKLGKGLLRKAKKKYYVRTRSYILNGRTKVYGAWSSTTSFTAK